MKKFIGRFSVPRSLLALSAIPFAVLGSVLPVDAATPYTFVEAETTPSGPVRDDPNASGGHYVAQNGAYQPMILVTLPASGDTFVIWARVRGEALQLKGISAEGSQHDLNWEWDKPDDWKWVSFGKHTRAELGSKFLLMRAPDATAEAGLDAVVLSTDETFSPESLVLKFPPRRPLSITVDWTKTGLSAGKFAYGLNAFRAFDPTITNNPDYQKNLKFMAPGVLRLHNGGMVGDSATDANAWVDYAHKGWDAPKIAKSLAGFSPGPALLLNIPNWPAWMDADHDGFLDADQVDAYAKLCAGLVKIVNRDLQKHVVYWEVTNERDGPYFVDFHTGGGWGPLKDSAKPDRVEELARIYVRCAVAMKAVDPAIRVGGPAQARPDLTIFAQRFARVAGPQLDFFSFHAYASGTKDDSDRTVYDSANGFGGWVDGFRKALASSVAGRTVPIFLDEYNVSWTWETRDPRMTNVKGAVFDALAMASAVSHGVTATTAWNECDGIYGKMDDRYNLRPSATLFRLMNMHMVGTVVSAESSSPGSVVAIAVKNSAGRSLLLINRSATPQSATLAGWGAKSSTEHQLSESGFVESKLTPAQLSAPIALPANSVTMLTD